MFIKPSFIEENKQGGTALGKPTIPVFVHSCFDFDHSSLLKHCSVTTLTTAPQFKLQRLPDH